MKRSRTTLPTPVPSGPLSSGALLLAPPRTLFVLVAARSAIVREGLGAIVESEADFAVVGPAADSDEVRRLLVDSPVDVAVVEASLGDEFLAAIRGSGRPARVLVLGVRDEDDEGRRAFDLGASGYVRSDVGAGRLVAALRSIADGDEWFPSTSDHSRLDEPERELLQKLADGRSTREIAVELAIPERRLRGRLERIFRSLGAANRTQGVLEALRRGWVQLR